MVFQTSAGEITCAVCNRQHTLQQNEQATDSTAAYYSGYHACHCATLCVIYANVHAEQTIRILRSQQTSIVCCSMTKSVPPSRSALVGADDL